MCRGKMAGVPGNEQRCLLCEQRVTISPCYKEEEAAVAGKDNRNDNVGQLLPVLHGGRGRRTQHLIVGDTSTVRERRFSPHP